MNPTRLMTVPCTITPRSPSGQDDYGDEVLEDGDPVETTCWLHQTQRSEITVDAYTTIETWQVYLPPGTELTALDRLTAQGAEFEVQGPPHNWTHPRTQVIEYVEATVRKVAAEAEVEVTS